VSADSQGKTAREFSHELVCQERTRPRVRSLRRRCGQGWFSGVPTLCHPERSVIVRRTLTRSRGTPSLSVPTKESAGNFPHEVSRARCVVRMPLRCKSTRRGPRGLSTTGTHSRASPFPPLKMTEQKVSRRRMPVWDTANNPVVLRKRKPSQREGLPTKDLCNSPLHSTISPWRNLPPRTAGRCVRLYRRL